MVVGLDNNALLLIMAVGFLWQYRRKMQMYVNSESRMGRLFLWSDKIWEEFTDYNGGGLSCGNTTNLCYFIRVIFVWMPLALFLNLLTWLSFLTALFLLPVYLFGIGGYLTVVRVIIGLVIAVCGVVAIVVGIKRHMNICKSEKKTKSKKSPAGMWFFFKKWVKAKKDNICPIIHLEDKNGEDGQWAIG